MRKLIIPIQFIVIMASFALNGYTQQTEERIINSLGMAFVLIQPGQFMMGSPEDEPGRYSGERLHTVNLTNPFYMQTTEVTQAQWKAVPGYEGWGLLQPGARLSQRQSFRESTTLQVPTHRIPALHDAMNESISPINKGVVRL